LAGRRESVSWARVMGDRVDYKEYATQCLREAEQSNHPEHKALLLMMAQAWLRLAAIEDRADRPGFIQRA
jgi:hypothetical protein